MRKIKLLVLEVVAGCLVGAIAMEAPPLLLGILAGSFMGLLLDWFDA